MAGFNGTAFTFDWDSVTLVGVRTRSLTVSNEYVDVTTDDSNGWKTLLSDPSIRSVEVTVGGILTNEALLADVMAANISGKPLTAKLPTALSTQGTLDGDYLITSYGQEASYDGSVEFSVTFASTGEIIYTPSA